MTEIKQSVAGSSIEQNSDYFEFVFEDLTDSNGTALDFSSYTAEVEVFSLYSNTPVFTIADTDIEMSSDDISVSYDTSGIDAYTPGEYRYNLNLTIGGKKYTRVTGRIYKH